MLEPDFAQRCPVVDRGETYGICAIAVARALAVEFPKPVPNLLTGCGNLDLAAFVLIDNEQAELADQALVKETRRTAFASICSRMIRNFE